MSEKYGDDSSHFGWGLLSFFFPFVGLILALVWNNSHTSRARACIVGILVATSMSIITSVISFSVLFYKILNPSYSGTGPNWNSNENYSPSQEQFNYPSPPNPYSAVYKDSSDGVLKFHRTNDDLPTVYDQTTNSVIACDKFTCSVYVYNATSGKRIFEKEYPQTIECFAAYGGKLAVALENSRTIEVISLVTFDSQQFNAKYYAYSMEVMDNAILFAGNDYGPKSNKNNCYIFKLVLSNGEVNSVLHSVYQPTFAVNREKNILYVAERGLSSCDLFYVNLKTNYAETKTEFMQYTYSNYELFYDGTYVHAFGNLYDTVRGKIKRQGQSIAEKFSDHTMYSTLCIYGRYSLTVTTDCKTVVYDSRNKKIVCTLDLYATRIYSLGDNKYIALCGNSGYYGLIDLNSVC